MVRDSGLLSSASIDPRSIVNILIISIDVKINNAVEAMALYGMFNNDELVKYIVEHNIKSNPSILRNKNLNSEEEVQILLHNMIPQLQDVDIFFQTGVSDVLGKSGFFYVLTIVHGTGNLYRVNGPISVAPWAVK